MSIPKIIHQIWFDFGKGLGPNLPEKYQKYRSLAIQHNKDYKFIIWNEKEAATIIKNKYNWFYSTYQNFENPVERVDAFKYILMHSYGGIYIDLDLICKKSFGDFLRDKSRSTNIVLSYESFPIINYFTLSNSILMSVPNHTFWIEILKYIASWDHSFMSLFSGIMEVMEKTGPFMMKYVYDNFRNKEDIQIFDNKYFIKNVEESYSYHISDKTWVNNDEFSVLIILVGIITIIVIILIINIIKYIKSKSNKVETIFTTESKVLNNNYP